MTLLDKSFASTNLPIYIYKNDYLPTCQSSSVSRLTIRIIVELRLDRRARKRARTIMYYNGNVMRYVIDLAQSPVRSRATIFTYISRTDSKRWLGEFEDRRFWFTTGSSPSPSSSASVPFHRAHRLRERRGKRDASKCAAMEDQEEKGRRQRMLGNLSTGCPVYLRYKWHDKVEAFGRIAFAVGKLRDVRDGFYT